MSNNKPTKAQHYVPKVYLKGFSQNGNTIFEYNLRSNKAIDSPVSIESVCVEKFLYEIKDNDKAIIHLNWLEKSLKYIEDRYDGNRQLLLSGIKDSNGYKDSYSFSEEEKVYWTLFVAVQILRNPDLINAMTKYLHPLIDSNCSENLIKNIVLYNCLPFFREPKEDDSNALIALLALLDSKAINICYARLDNLFTSDKVIFIHRETTNDKSTWDFQRLWFPLTSDCALLFSEPSLVDSSNLDVLIPLTNKDIRFFNESIAFLASEVVLSKYPFSEEDIKLIRGARAKRLKERTLTKQE